MTTTVERNPFARGEYARFTTMGACSWCGSYRATLYQYEWWADDKRKPNQSSATPAFCNLTCFHSYCG